MEVWNALKAIGTPLLGFLLLFIPFVLYVVVKRKYSLKHGVVTTCLTTLLGFGVVFFVFDGMEAPLIAAVVVLFILSAISYFTENDLYFRLEPAIKSFITSLFLLIFRLFGEPVLLNAARSLSAPKVGEGGFSPLPMDLASPLVVESINLFEIHIIFWGFVYGAVMVLAALRWSDVSWLIAKAAQSPVLLGGSVITTLLYNILILPFFQ